MGVVDLPSTKKAMTTTAYGGCAMMAAYATMLRKLHVESTFARPKRLFKV